MAAWQKVSSVQTLQEHAAMPRPYTDLDQGSLRGKGWLLADGPCLCATVVAPQSKLLGCVCVRSGAGASSCAPHRSVP